MEPIIRAVHARVALHKYVPLIQKFVGDLLQTSKGGKDSKTKTRIPPSVEDYVVLLRKHKPSLFNFLHEVSSCCPEIQKLFLDWVKEASTSFRRPPPPAEHSIPPRQHKPEELLRSRSVHSNGSNGYVDRVVGFGGGGGGGALGGNLQALYAALPRETQHQVEVVLDLHADYLASLNQASHQNLQQIVDRLAGVRESAVRRSMQGPGVYLARWHALLDSTVITPAAPGRGVPMRSGRDVNGVKASGKTGVKGAAGEGESESGSEDGGLEDTVSLVPSQSSGSNGSSGRPKAPREPDAWVVVEALGRPFRELVARISGVSAREVSNVV